MSLSLFIIHRVRRAGSSPWYQEIREESRDAKHSWRRAEREWLKPGFTVHHQIYSAAKRLVTTVVHKVKSRFFCTQIANSSSSKQLSTVCKRLSGRDKTSLPNTNPLGQFPDVFCDYLTRTVTDMRSDLDKQTRWLPWFVFVFAFRPSVILSGVWAGT